MKKIIIGLLAMSSLSALATPCETKFNEIDVAFQDLGQCYHLQLAGSHTKQEEAIRSECLSLKKVTIQTLMLDYVKDCSN